MDRVSPQRADKSANRPNAPQNGQSGEGGGSGQPGTPSSGQSWRWLWGVLAIGIVAILLAVGTIKTTNAKTITYTQFMKDVAAKQVSTAKISNSTGEITGNLKDGTSYQAQGPTPSLPNDVSEMRSNGVEVSFPTPSSNLLSDLLPYIFIIGIGAAFIYFIGRQTRGQMSGIMSIGRSKAKTFSSDRPSTTFEDVAGYNGVKQEISEVVDFLKKPARFKDIGARIPKGVLLVGPPGTGKTMLARAVAGEAGVPFFSISGSEFVEMFVGVGAARVRDLFQQAASKAPAIIFIDELDALGRARGAYGGGGHDEKEQTLNQLLVELDGFDSSTGLVLLGATNRPEILDPALLRAGRFDRVVVVDRPDKPGRQQILSVHAKKIKLEADVDLEKIAAMTPGFTGADLANLVNEAALVATRRGAEAVSLDDFSQAIERLVAGLEKKNRVLNATERKVVAHHEMGHAMVAMALPGTDPVHKISIIPRGVAALGYTLQRPTEDRFVMTRDELENKMAVLLGGRAAEEVVFSHLSTGAANDLAKVTEIARSMVMRYGMVKSLGHVAYEEERAPFLGGPLPTGHREYSEETAREIDVAVRQIVDSVYQKTRAILERHRALLERWSHRLLEKESLGEGDLDELRRELAPA
ncbi:MAG: ATP-dependent zinc metalloprotease FtsH [Methylobacteriaceae bacterium]|nr:ATP-dependent zinc metalloprotease FtsH [Methylobacteriaceae bacterium]